MKDCVTTEKFIAFRKCGCLQGFVSIVDVCEEDTRKSAAKVVAKWILDGMYIMHLQGELAEKYDADFYCKEHRSN